MKNLGVVLSAAALAFMPALPAAAATTSSPVAYVYVTNGSQTGPNKICAYAAAANGKLTLVPGSPFVANVNNIVVNGKYLFGATTSGLYVAAFQMQPNGALHWTYSTKVANYNSTGCSSTNNLVLDHTGASLYLTISTGSLCDHSAYQTYTIDKSNGRLQFAGTSSSTFLYSDPFSFDKWNKFAYGSQCINYQGNYLDTFTALQRDSTGFLTVTGIPQPDPNDGDNFYCASYTAADPAGHLAISLQAIQQGSVPVGNPIIASYTENSSGNLSTSTPISAMPTTAVGYVYNLAMSPSGKVLAVSGSNGLQFFHFNGAAPATKFTGLVISGTTGSAFWDNANHLYAIGPKGLYVFTVTSTSVTQAPGSPYAVNSPYSLIVQPKTAR